MTDLVARWSRSAHGRRRNTALGMAAAALGAATVVAASGPAQAAAAFTLTTSAQGVSYEIDNQSFPFVSSVQLNEPTATASLNNRGQATAYSAAPDPDQTIAELPTTAAATVCGQIAANGFNPPGCAELIASIPPYPYAYAQAGDPPQDKDLPAGHLHAEATDTSSEAQTTSGANGAADAMSTARTVANDVGMDATADTAVNSLSLAVYLKLSGIHASAAVHRSPGGDITKTSSFDIGSFAVNGQTFGLHNGQFTLAGTVVDVPVPVQTVLDALAAVGVKATYLPATADANGITSAGLTMSFSLPGAPAGAIPALPPTPLPVQVGVPTTPTTVTYTLGRVSVHGTYRAIPDAPTGIIGGTLPPTVPASSAPVVITPSQPGAVGGSTPTELGSPSGGAVTVPPTLDAGAPPAVASAPTSTAAAANVRGFRPVTSHGLNIYLIFIIGSVLAFGGTTAIRIVGVRHSWTS